jgi:hypothetical protein
MGTFAVLVETGRTPPPTLEPFGRGGRQGLVTEHATYQCGRGFLFLVSKCVYPLGGVVFIQLHRIVVKEAAYEGVRR